MPIPINSINSASSASKLIDRTRLLQRAIDILGYTRMTTLVTPLDLLVAAGNRKEFSLVAEVLNVPVEDVKNVISGPAPSTRVFDLGGFRTQGIVTTIQKLLWRTDGRWDPDKQWPADLIEEVARVLADKGLRPE